MDEWTRMRGSQIPAFGNWEYVNELPITQYFECARQAGLIRYSSSSSSGEYDQSRHCYYNNYSYGNNFSASGDLYSVDYVKQLPTKQGRERRSEGIGRKVREGSRQTKVFDVTVTELPRPVKKKKKQDQLQYEEATTRTCRSHKAVDEDLYHIPPELFLKRKRRLGGFFTRCLVPPCVVY